MIHRSTILGAVGATAIGLLCLASVAQANPNNSIQPGRTFFNTVVAGQHPTKTLTLHNGTGTTQMLGAVQIRGGHGHAFQVADGSCFQTPPAPGQAPVAVKYLRKGATCTIKVRVRTNLQGWWRAVISVEHGPSANASWWSGQLEAHVVAAS